MCGASAPWRKRTPIRSCSAGRSSATTRRRVACTAECSRVGLVWIATLSRDVRDPLCGFRCVPLAPALQLANQVSMGRRMDFEPEIAVRLVWMGVPVVNLPTRVCYLQGGLSHFDVVWDDLRLAWLYVRIAIGMLVRAPELLRRRAAERTWA